jgi:hypothetical protein
MPAETPWTAATVRAHADKTLSFLVDTWQQHGDIGPVAVLYAERGEAVAVPGLEEVPKDHLPQFLRFVAAHEGAPYVLFACCASFVEVSDEVSADDLVAWQQAGRTLHDHPASRECLFVSVDGPGLCIGMRAMRADDGQISTEVIDNSSLAGRMSNLSGRMGEN